MTQHASLSPERWSSFSLDQQILMIANELSRAGKLTGPGDRMRQKSSYERVLNLTDLTIRVQTKPTFRREMLRWRDLAAALYVSEEPDLAGHELALRTLLRFTPEASKQLDPRARGTG